MGSVTGNFHSEAPLSPAVLSAIDTAFKAGWAEPNKASHEAAKARALRDGALEEISKHLGVPNLIPYSDVSIAIQFSIMGYLKPEMKFAHSIRDRREVMAIGKSHQNSIAIEIDRAGQVTQKPNCDLFAFQVANPETGIIQNQEVTSGLIACDATASGARVPLPTNWASAAFEAKSWGGPSGISFLALQNEKDWSYPLPHVGVEKSPGNYSLPLLVGAAVALEEFKRDRATKDERLLKLNQLIRKQLTNYNVAAPIGLPHLLTIGFEDVNGELLVSQLNEVGIYAETGSACSADDLRPSRTLAAMGLPNKGNLRITLHDDVSETEVNELVKRIAACA
ncbi:MAG: hypothetical protein RL448_637 [Actinomycetota bacterium]